MDVNELRQMARKAMPEVEAQITDDELELFAALIAAAEREACCSIVYAQCESDNVAQRTVDAIRARGENP